MRLVLDPQTWSSWQPEIKTASGPAPLKQGDLVEGHADMLGFKRVGGRSIAHHVEDRRFEEHVIVGVPMRIIYEVAERDGDVEVTRTISADLPRGPFGSLLSVFLRRRLRKMQHDVLAELVKQAKA